MEFGFLLEQAAGAASQVSSAVGPTFWLIMIVAVAGVGKLIFIGWGDKLSPSGLLGSLPGGALIGFAALILVVGMFISDREVKALVKFQQTFVDPVIVDILGRDSCNPERNRFCVVTWDDDGREILVNWHDRRITAFDIYGDYDFTLFESIRPQLRPTLLLQPATEG